MPSLNLFVPPSSNFKLRRPTKMADIHPAERIAAGANADFAADYYQERPNVYGEARDMLDGKRRRRCSLNGLL